MTQLLLKLYQPYAYGHLDAGAVATVRLLADPKGAVVQSWWSAEKPVAISGADGSLGAFTTFDLPQPGYYAVDIARPRGADVTAQYLVNDGEIRSEIITLAASPHEYLGWQQYAGIVRPNPYQNENEAIRPSTASGASPWLEGLRRPEAWRWPPCTTGPRRPHRSLPRACQQQPTLGGWSFRLRSVLG